MAKVKPIYQGEGNEIYGYRFRCPGCGGYHTLRTLLGDPSARAMWDFNGNLEKPTFSPSVLSRHSTPEIVCHSFVREGRIEFLGDCTHELAGQTVELPEVEA
jgi:hypothetical protein